MREISPEELLGRGPIHVEAGSAGKSIAGQSVLVTGAAGSIGSELCRQILGYSPKILTCLDQNETGLFDLEAGLNDVARDPKARIRIGDVTNYDRNSNILAEAKPAVIFHAAAYKHVPMMEANVSEAVRNNVFGLLALLDAAEASGCARFVLVSSDKAVRPANIMGATKRLCELIVASRPPSRMKCISVRFGNVLGSAGSVLPTWQRQLRQGRPLTVTDAGASRYFLTAGEAASLLPEAVNLGEDRDTLVFDSGAQLNIHELARRFGRLSAHSAGPAKIEFTGLRAGEKLSEELYLPSEKRVPTGHAHIYRALSDERVEWAPLRAKLDELEMRLGSGSAAHIRELVQALVPEYSLNPSAAVGTAKHAFHS